jgi:cytochrome c-type biogenesis protein
VSYLQSLIDSVQFPFLTAFILGLMTAISPCPLATNITATAYISKELGNGRQVFISGLIYTLGRMFSYTFLGIVLYLGASKFHVSRLFQANGEKFIGPVLLIIGVLMLDVINFSRIMPSNLTDRMTRKLKFRNLWASFFLGVIFALAFCPYSGVLFFGMLIPLTLTSPLGILLPPVFAVATALPVISIAYLIAFSLSRVGAFYNRIRTAELWFRRFAAVIFILCGLYFIGIYFFKLPL